MIFGPWEIYVDKLAATAGVNAGGDCAANACDTGLPVIQANNANLQYVLGLVLGIITAMTVIVIIVAGLRMIVSVGDPQAVTRLRKTIMYAVIGLIISLMADVIVALLLGRL